MTNLANENKIRNMMNNVERGNLTEASSILHPNYQLAHFDNPEICHNVVTPDKYYIRL